VSVRHAVSSLRSFGEDGEAVAALGEEAVDGDTVAAGGIERLSVQANRRAIEMRSGLRTSSPRIAETFGRHHHVSCGRVCPLLLQQPQYLVTRKRHRHQVVAEWMHREDLRICHFAV